MALLCSLLRSCLKLLPSQGARSSASLRALRRFSADADQAPRAARAALAGETDRFGGVTVRHLPAQLSQASFSSALRDSLSQWRSEGRIAVWLYLPLAQCRLAEVAALHGFTFHHALGDVAVLSLWMGPGESRLPGYATHQVGVAGAVLNEANGRVLVVQDKNKIVSRAPTRWFTFTLQHWSKNVDCLGGPDALCRHYPKDSRNSGLLASLKKTVLGKLPESMRENH